ncbi:hypothetical protein [Halobacillus kuroshimensis]|uniref:hypothetical protein n=1 Tax=Halobacillus kuroshimensis TaxID=302481 RepID=UPI00041D4895|nr:hypothetical protein [Halobacillus kuroshimensis]
MKGILLVLLSVLFLTACQSEREWSFSEIGKKDLPGDALSYFQTVKNRHGNHMFQDGDQNIVYIYLNGTKQGEGAEYYTSFEVRAEEDTLNLLYKTEAGAGGSLKSERFYRVDGYKSYEILRIYENGKEAVFETISLGG